MLTAIGLGCESVGVVLRPLLNDYAPVSLLSDAARHGKMLKIRDLNGMPKQSTQWPKGGLGGIERGHPGNKHGARLTLKVKEVVKREEEVQEWNDRKADFNG